MKFPYFVAPLKDVEWRIETHPIGYADALEFMEERVEQIHQNTHPEMIWILEHPPIYTLGTSGKESDLLDARVPFIKTSRGGQVTYHGPGQSVIYVMLKMSRFNNDLKAYLRFLKQGMSEPLRAMGVDIIEDDSTVGLWARHPQLGPAKLAFIGIRIRKGISFHGISLNVAPDLQAFSKIVPCGVRGEQVTSLKDLGIKNPSLEV